MSPRGRTWRASSGFSGIVWLGAFVCFALWTFWRLGGFDLWTAVVMSDGRTVRFPNTFATVDHPFHATRAETLRQSLAGGELLRWVGSHQGGYPVEFYALGAAWMEVAVWAGALGSLPMMAIHKLVVIGVFLLPVAGFAALARYGGLPWSVPLLAIVIHVSVRGWWWSGGYMELIEWGLLTNVASAALLPLCLALTRHHLRGPSNRLLVGSSAVASLAIYTNVRSLLPLAAIVAGVAFTAWIDRLHRVPVARIARRLMGIAGLTLLLSAPLVVALIRFEDLYIFVRYSSYGSLTEYWHSSVQAVSSPVLALALVGALFAVVSRRDDGARTVLIVLALYVAGTALTVLSSQAADLVSQLEATRLMPFQRLLVMYLAAYGVWNLVERAAMTRPPARSEGTSAAEASWESSIVPGSDGEILRSARNETVKRGVVSGAAMVVVMNLMLAGYIGGWIPVIPESDRATGTLFTTGNNAIAELRDAVELADKRAEPGTAVLVLGGVVSWHDQLWAPQWSDRRFFYDDWLWYWQTDHVGDYDPRTSHAYDDDASALEASYLDQHGIGAVIVTGQASQAAAASPLLTAVTEGGWSVYLVDVPTPIMTAGGAGLSEPSINNHGLSGVAVEPATEFIIRHNWYPRWAAEVDGRSATIAKDDAGYMRVVADEPGRSVRLTYRVDAWDWLARLALVGGVTISALLLAADLRRSDIAGVRDRWRRNGERRERPPAVRT